MRWLGAMYLPRTSLKVGILVSMNYRLYRVVVRIREVMVVTVQKSSALSKDKVGPIHESGLCRVLTGIFRLDVHDQEALEVLP